MKLSTDEKIRFVTGKGMWHTSDLSAKLPSIHLADGPHGLRKQEENIMQNNLSKVSTCYPTASALACSWDADLAAKLADSLAQDALREDVSVVLGPGVNIKRFPLCGRNFEYFSEDPYLTGKLASAYVRAMQMRNVGTSLKHFAGNSQETHRQTANSQIDERALREIYLSAFEMVVKEARPASVMASYNRVNGEYSCENRHLLKDILRDEWGYDGTVISDWGACADLTKSISAGMDLEMPDSLGIHGKKLKASLEKGEISAASLDRAVENVYQLIERYAVERRGKKLEDGIDTHEIAREIECQSAVLLKNDGILPLKENAEVVVIGELAEYMRFQGGGSSHIATNKIVNVIDALKEYDIKVEYAKGYSADSVISDNLLEEEAIRLAQNNLPVLFFGGLTDIAEGEGFDRTDYSMPGNQIRLLEKIRAVNADIVFVAFGGSPFDMSFADQMRAILHMYLGGEAVGEACADLLTGAVNPSGKLAESYPCRIEDTACCGLFATGSDDVEYRESIFVGYRYYDTYNVPVRFPFGHGLSYTDFEYSDISVNQQDFCGGELRVSLTIKNIGTRSGREIVQIYVKNPECTYLRPRKELRGFTKVFLEPGESRRITILLTDRSFSIYDKERRKFIMPSGDYEVLAAASSADIRLGIKVHVQGTDYERNDREQLSEYFRRDGTRLHISGEQFRRLYDGELSSFDKRQKGDYSIYNSLAQLSERSVIAKIVLRIAKKEAYRMFRGKRRDDPEVMMLIEGLQNGTIDSVSCQSGGAIPYRFAEAIVLEANGYRIRALKRLLGGEG